jgi:hypothetical protein
MGWEFGRFTRNMLLLPASQQRILFAMCCIFPLGIRKVCKGFIYSFIQTGIWQLWRLFYEPFMPQTDVTLI